MVYLEEELEPSPIYANFEDVSARKAASRCSVEDFKVPAAAPAMKMYRLVVVSLGILCIIQAALIIYLISAQNSLTEERDDLKRINLDLEASSKNLTEERDELNRTLENYVSEQNSLTEERDNLKRINLDLEAKLKMTVSQQNSLTEERDKLKRINLNMVATNTNLAKERDDLKKGLTASIVQPVGLYIKHSDLEYGWMVFSGSLYTVSSIQKNWQESRDDCIQKGADLVTINSQEEQNFLNQFDKTMWLGLTDLETEGTWKWVDGTPMTERYWGPGEPNGRTSENCGQIKQFNVGKRWNDENCNTKTFWTCEKKVSP